MANAHAHRLSSRVLLFDREDRILLFLQQAPDSSGVSRWITPGGGVDPGETHEQAAIRELWEETGLLVDSVGASVWHGDFGVRWDSADHDTGHAEFYSLVVDRFEPSRDNWTEEELREVSEYRWWSLAELLAEAPVHEPDVLIPLIRRQLPSCPI